MNRPEKINSNRDSLIIFQFESPHRQYLRRQNYNKFRDSALKKQSYSYFEMRERAKTMQQ